MGPKFFAEIHLFPTEGGGRKDPLMSGKWRTVLGINQEHWSALLIFPGNPSPGETILAEVRLLFADVASPFFPLGAEFTVWEGGVKGTGRVVSRAT